MIKTLTLLGVFSLFILINNATYSNGWKCPESYMCLPPNIVVKHGINTAKNRTNPFIFKYNGQKYYFEKDPRKFLKQKFGLGNKGCIPIQGPANQICNCCYQTKQGNYLCLYNIEPEVACNLEP